MNAGGASGLRMSFEATHNNARNCSIVRPASRTIPPIVIALTGLCRGIVRMREPFPITTCFPCLRTTNPTF